MVKKILLLLIILIVFFGTLYFQRQHEKINENIPPIPTNTNGKTNQNPTQTTGSGNVNVTSGLSLQVSSPTDKTTLATSTVTVSGKTNPGADVFINDKQLKADASGSFSTQVALDEGENSIIVVANDASGNYAERDLTVYLESTQ